MNNLENIKEIIDQSPSSSGIYKMLNEKRRDYVCWQSKKSPK